MPTTLTLETNASYFESIYAAAEGDPCRIPWADSRPSPSLVNWLNAVAPSLVRCGARVAVVGCGLGDDARTLIDRGYEVTAFDCSAPAVQWAKRRDPSHSDSYQHADLFAPPPRWRRRFDLVVEVNTLQSLTPDLHGRAMHAISDLMAPHGRLLVICRGATGCTDGPPWELSESGLSEMSAMAGMVPDDEICAFHDDQDPPTLRLRALFRRA